MTLFFVGVIEMIISASWTKSVSKANVALTGAITSVNIFIWYYVIRTVVGNLDNWFAIIPYTAGCAIGAMLGAIDLDKMMKRIRTRLAAMKAVTPPVQKPTKAALNADLINN
jgi:hypothetical protein